jgi:hypothetical protein
LCFSPKVWFKNRRAKCRQQASQSRLEDQEQKAKTRKSKTSSHSDVSPNIKTRDETPPPPTTSPPGLVSSGVPTDATAHYPSPTLTPASGTPTATADAYIPENAQALSGFWSSLNPSGVNCSLDYSGANRSTLVMQVKASSLSPQGLTPHSAANYGHHSYSHSYYSAGGLDLAYFNHASHGNNAQYHSPYLGSSQSVLRPPGLPCASDYDYPASAERYQHL